jgi:hypothetical protein
MRKHDEEILRGINRLSREMVTHVVLGRTLAVLGYFVPAALIVLQLLYAAGQSGWWTASLAGAGLYAAIVILVLRRALPGSTRIPTLQFNERVMAGSLLGLALVGFVLLQSVAALNLAIQGGIALFLLTYTLLSRIGGRLPGALVWTALAAAGALLLAAVLQQAV